jgi:hypothetical protein
MSKDSKLHINTLVKIQSLIENGREEITTKKELEKYPIGSLVSYLTKTDVFKDAGFIYKFGDTWFIYISVDFSQKYRVRYHNVKTLWVGDVFHTKNDTVSINKCKEKSNYPIKIGNTVVYYADTPFKEKRYKLTEKYRRMTTWYEYFGKENTSNKNNR